MAVLIAVRKDKFPAAAWKCSETAFCHAVQTVPYCGQAPGQWNSLPLHVTSALSRPIFKRQLKTALYTRSNRDCAARAWHLHLLLWLLSLFFLYCTVS